MPELHEMAGDQPIMLHQVSVAGLFRQSHWRTIRNWIKALKTLEVLKPGRSGDSKLESGEIFYVE
jgi:hypothetical protein